ncbi:mitochondrial import inner membrane translocase subunit tim54 [Scheffersomyces spartinae]|uniref:Mitochondrial import inner membrane translocase subunit TIM54 n=1 Tax=Scheffersomyces spartinae TaxID=45513 RepID=A0A9P8AGV1_9ASCO|nr:mitochondrial import inner membrane translocase subunit tim54 [Scheffersomyces spartinae]KAG7191457.1 mitochondrial import inner membrane translocase subunit tim54 [Scheffersomyces spartinae]
MTKDTTTSPPVKKGITNPALQMMGIKRLALPSRNWMIFWSIVGAIGGGIAYDKHQQKQARMKYTAQVQSLSTVPYEVNRLPRKLTIFIAPPPNDFLATSVLIFLKFIKPVFNAAAVDFDIFTESRQGDIRSSVAEKIRQLRREKLEEEKMETNQKVTKHDDAGRTWTKFKNLFSTGSKTDDEVEVTVDRHDLYTPKDVLGLYKVVEPVTVKRDDEENELFSGGVICIGRGAYKEYLTGIHEGLLGPLEKPQWLVEEELKEQEAKQQEKKEKEEQNENKQHTEDEKEEEIPVPKAWIKPEEYGSAEYAPEFQDTFQNGALLRNKKNTPVLFEQPVYVFPVVNIQGFLRIPEKIYRFFTTREVAESMGAEAVEIVHNRTRKFELKRDEFMGSIEEKEWPKKWVKSGLEKGSEWVQPLIVDPRVVERIRVYQVDV